MSRNLCDRRCGYCHLDEVIITGQLVRFEEYYPDSRYRSEYTGMVIAEAECAYCESKYIAWVTPPIGGRNAYIDEDWAENRKFYDLSYRSTFNDEPGKTDVPAHQPPSPVKMKALAKEYHEKLMGWIEAYEKLDAECRKVKAILEKIDLIYKRKLFSFRNRDTIIPSLLKEIFQ